MAGYIGKSQGVTQVDGYTADEADSEFVNDPNAALNISSSASADSATIDASGNLLVGKTSTGAVGAGSSIGGTGVNYMTADAAATLRLNRETSDGDIIQLRKDNSTVGSIGTVSGLLTIGSGDTGLIFNSGGNSIYGVNPTTGSTLDATIDLGVNVKRFKDLYLSGGVYLGGTGSANYLDDYETGTWTPEQRYLGSLPTITAASYIKTGSTVFFTLDFQTITTSNGDRCRITLPFTPIAYGTVQIFACPTSYNTYGNNLYGEIRGGGEVEFRSSRSGGNLTNANLSNVRITLSGSYIAA